MNAIQAYNYDTFVGEKIDPWLRLDKSPPLGLTAPNFSLTTLDGRGIRLSEVWRKTTYTIVEFGSLT